MKNKDHNDNEDNNNNINSSWIELEAFVTKCCNKYILIHGDLLEIEWGVWFPSPSFYLSPSVGKLFTKNGLVDFTLYTNNRQLNFWLMVVL